jgi:hypothetical protein
MPCGVVAQNGEPPAIQRFFIMIKERFFAEC